MQQERDKGKFPSQPIMNPQGQHYATSSSSNPNGVHEQEKSITALRSGKVLDNPVVPPPKISPTLLPLPKIVPILEK